MGVLGQVARQTQGWCPIKKQLLSAYEKELMDGVLCNIRTTTTMTHSLSLTALTVHASLVGSICLYCGGSLTLNSFLHYNHTTSGPVLHSSANTSIDTKCVH